MEHKLPLVNFFGSKDDKIIEETRSFKELIAGCSIEVMPRTAAKIENFQALLPKGTRVYIAHIDGTTIEDMVATAKRLTDQGFAAMPHFPARIIPNLATLEDWAKRYHNEAGVEEALVLGGGIASPAGELHSSMQMLDSGIFDRYGFKRLHVAGHPEGNKDIDKDGSTTISDQALKTKYAFAERTGAEMAIVTQFAFDAKPVIAWAERIKAAGINLPIHLGIAGPAKLQTLIRYGLACGVGPSLAILQKRALDFSKLLVPYEPTDFLTTLSKYIDDNPNTLIQKIHVFPLGGLHASANWIRSKSK
jgi:methylenetetrahydrofolate reductase (NADPH)